MALIKKTELNQMEIVGPYKHIQVRMSEWVEDDATGEKVGGESYNRYVVSPGDDVSGKPADVQTIARDLHTADLAAKYKAAMAAQEQAA